MHDLSEKKIQIETDRFLLRTLEASDASERYQNWFEDADAKKYIDASAHSPTVSSLQKFIEEKHHQVDALFFGIFCIRSGLHIGNIKFEPICDQNKSAVMGILIGDPEWRGRGVAGEVLDMCCQWLSEHLGTTRIYLGVKKINVAAVKAYERVGFEEITGDCPIPQVDDSIAMIKLYW